MVGPLLERLGLDLIETYWIPDGEFPDHEPNPLLPENRRFDDRPGARRGRRPRASPGTATPTAASSSTTAASSSTGTSSPRCSPARCCGKRAGGDDPLRRPRQPRGRPTRCASSAAAPHVNRVGHAFFKVAMRERGAAFGGEVSGHYYFRDFWCADSGTIPALLVLELLSVDGRPLSELVGEFRERYFISGEINSEVADPEAKMRELAERSRRRRGRLARRRLGRLPRLALQRPSVEHRAPAAAQPRVAGLARGHGAKARRGPRADSLVTVSPEEALEARRATRASTGCGSRPRSRSGGSTAT